MDTGRRDAATLDNPRIAAGWAFFGQILAHDMTRDRAPLQPTQLLDGLRNYRRPRLDLECVYGDGPLGQPYLYDAFDGDKLLLAPNDLGEPNDLPRTHQGIAVIGDQRNDTCTWSMRRKARAACRQPCAAAQPGSRRHPKILPCSARAAHR